MINVTITHNKITVTGHAYYAQRGSPDIVCASVSMLFQSLIESLEQLTTDKIEYNLESGNSHINFKDLSAGGKLLVDSFYLGILLLIDAYPNHVSKT